MRDLSKGLLTGKSVSRCRTDMIVHGRGRTADEGALPTRHPLVLLGGLTAGLLFGSAAGAPFRIDVGAGHAVFYLAGALGAMRALRARYSDGDAPPTAAR